MSLPSPLEMDVTVDELAVFASLPASPPSLFCSGCSVSLAAILTWRSCCVMRAQLPMLVLLLTRPSLAAPSAISNLGTPTIVVAGLLSWV